MENGVVPKGTQNSILIIFYKAFDKVPLGTSPLF